jgi:hypothetical protein
MFVGHLAVAMAAKKKAPEVSLGLLVGAAVWLDMVWPIFLLLGIERMEIDPGNTRFTPFDFVYYPWTHSLVMALAWSASFAFALAAKVRRPVSRLLLAALVFSHWVLDFIVHRPDLPLWPDHAPKVGLGLWNSIAGTIVVEGTLLLAGVWIYVRATRPRDRVGRFAFWAFILFCVIVWLGDLGSAPPTNSRIVAWVALAGWLLPLWAWWADGHRHPC